MSAPLTFLSGLESDVLAEWRKKSTSRIYQTDPEAWLADVLHTRWHSKQREVGHSFMHNPRVLVKSGNGSGKSRMVGELVSWGASVFEIGEVLSIVSAPTLRQVEQVVFAYLKDNYGKAKVNGYPLPGVIGDSLEWVYREHARDPKKTLVIGMKPSDQDVVSTFQGIRAINDDTGGRTRVFIDEAGGVPSDLFTAAEAVTTGAGNSIMGIGNPDRLGTEFHEIFVKGEEASGWKLHTISVLDLPTITGEIVYPGEPWKQKAMIGSGMNDQAWVDQAKKAWGEDSARYLSKVLGEFPDSDDRSFFSQSAIDTAFDTKIIADTENRASLGCDVARFGEDDSMAYLNLGGHVRKLESWSKTTTNESASNIHRLALAHGAHEVIIDAAGLGAGIADQVAARANGYRVVKTLGAYASPDSTIWLNARAYWYDKFREAMMAGEIDLDPSDEQLKKELLLIQYEYTPKGQIKIESKKDMASRGVKSPDALDAVIYSYITDLPLGQAAAAGLNKGDVVMIDPMEALGMLDRSGLPV